MYVKTASALVKVADTNTRLPGTTDTFVAWPTDPTISGGIVGFGGQGSGGERGFYLDVPEEAFHRVERRYGPFARSLTLPPTANADRIEASFDKGVLTIQVPKAEEAKPKKIAIKATS